MEDKLSRTNADFYPFDKLCFVGFLCIHEGAIATAGISYPPRVVFAGDQSMNAGAQGIRQDNIAVHPSTNAGFDIRF